MSTMPPLDPRIAPQGSLIGQPTVRIDGRAKVTGRAVYASDEPVGPAAQAFLLTSTIARGHIRRFGLDDARAVPGVLDILTWENVGHEAEPPPAQSGGTTTTMQDNRIWHDGQIIGVVVAETYEAAREAAYRTHVDYDETPPSATFGSAGAETQHRAPGEHEDYTVGDFGAAWAGAPVRVDAHYGTPTQHHNPIELFTTTCAWQNGQLTIWEPSQFVHGLRASVAKQLKMPPERVHVVSRFIGGAFGSRGAATARTAWIAVASRRLGGRPVKLVATRHQGFTIATYRAETRHHVQLGADHEGRLQALRHEGWEVTSRPSNYNVSGTETTARMYACPAIETRVNTVHADRNTPGFMRAPPDTPYMFALESAMDELAHALALDPIELRRRNDTMVDPVRQLPFTTRQLMRCFDEGAQRFGWSRRNPLPGALQDGDWLIGLGCASAAYPANYGVGSARVTLYPTGRARVQLGVHDIGTGALTVVAQVAASCLGLPVDAVQVDGGDSQLPAVSLAAGSSHAAAISHAVARACGQIVEQMARAAVAAAGPFKGCEAASLRLCKGMLVTLDPDGAHEPLKDAMARVSPGAIETYAENVPDGLPPESMQKVLSGQPALLRGHQRPHDTAYSFGAQFAEVRIHRLTREIRVPRMVGAFASGTILNPRTAHSQYMGGMIWGLGAALLEETEVDLRHARYINDNIAEYLVAANADVSELDVVLVPEDDPRVNPLGIKGVGEIGIVGMNAAIANAVFNATGRRVRDLPIRMEALL